MRMAMSALLICNTGCRPAEHAPMLRLSAGSAENRHLITILLSHNKDSVVDCAVADHQHRHYYLFISATPEDAGFDHYLAAYARQKYQLILVNCGCRVRPGACWYNEQMQALLAKVRPVSFGSVYLEARSLYNKTLPVYAIN
jgi:hypothetical protein